MKTAVITQARMTSTRLPGKVLREAAGITMLEHHLARLTAAGLPVIVATTTNIDDDPVAVLADKLGAGWSVAASPTCCRASRWRCGSSSPTSSSG